jgi:hypothetical protein
MHGTSRATASRRRTFARIARAEVARYDTVSLEHAEVVECRPALEDRRIRCHAGHGPDRAMQKAVDRDRQCVD